MKAIVVDLELNQPSCNIIEIGAVLVDMHSYQVLDTFDLICNPEGEMPNDFIVELTKITPEMVANGVPLKEALEQFWKWVEDCKAGGFVIEWGMGDTKALIQQSKAYGIEVPKLNTLNLKAVAGITRHHKGTKSKGGLGNTLTLYGIPFVGQPHSAVADAFNTALLLFRFEEMWKFAAIVEESHGDIKTRNYNEAIEKFNKLRSK